MNYKKYLLLLSFSLVFTNLTCHAEDFATQEEVCVVEDSNALNGEVTYDPESEITTVEDNFDFDLEDLNTEDVAALMEQIKVIEEQPHDTTWAQKFEFLKVFLQMQANNVWDELKTDPVIYSVATASLITSIVVLIYAVKYMNSGECNSKTTASK